MSQALKKRKLSPGYLEVFAIALLTAGLTVVATTMLYDRFFAQKIRTVDLQAYMKNQKYLILSGKAEEDQWKTGLNAMERTIRNEPSNHVILLKEVVLRNADEIDIR